MQRGIQSRHAVFVVVQHAVGWLLEEQLAEVEHLVFRFIVGDGSLTGNQFGVTHDIVERGVAHLCQILPYLLCQEGEVVHQILVSANEMLSELGVLGGDAQRTGVEVALAHHYTAQHNETGGTKTKLLGSEQCHGDDVSTSLYLSIHLQAHLSTQSVFHQCLLCFAQTYLGRDTCEAHTGSRTGSCASLGS